MSYFDFVFGFFKQPGVTLRLGRTFINNTSHKNIFIRLRRSCSLIFFYLFRKKPNALTCNAEEGKILFFAHTINQLLSLKPIIEYTDKKALIVLISTDAHLLTYAPSAIPYCFIDIKLIKRQYYRLPFFIGKAFISDPLFFLRFFDAIISNFGYENILKKYIEKLKPIGLVMSNDHNPICRTFLWSAQKKNLKTVYVQHAAVSDLFPPLQFDLAILDGCDSFQKYKKTNNVDVRVIGSAKFAQYSKFRKHNKKLSSIGVCFSVFDSLETLKNLLDYLILIYPNIVIKVRPHPNETRLFEYENSQVIFSNAKAESIFEFLLKVDVVISGNSSVHLEATALNILSIYLSLFCNLAQMDDYYGFVKGGMIIRVENLNDLKKVIDTSYMDDVYLKAKKFVYSIGEKNEADTAQIIAMNIINFCSSTPT